MDEILNFIGSVSEGFPSYFFINIRICPTKHVLISDNLPVRKSYFDSNIILSENARILRHFFKDYLKRTSTEAHVTTSSRRES